MTEPIEDEPTTQVVSEVGPWAMVPVWVLSKGLTPAELAVYISLRSFADKQGAAHPKARTIAERAMVAVGTARNAIQSLRDKSLLTTEEVWRADGSLAGLTYRMKDVDPTPGFVPGEKKPRGTRGKGSRTKDVDAPVPPAPPDVPPSIDTPPAPLGAGGGTPSGAGGTAPLGVGGSTSGSAGVDTKWCTQEHTKRTHQVGTPSEPPSEVRRDPDSSIQPTLDGKVPPAADHEPTAQDIAFGIARAWIDWRKGQGTPVAGNKPLHQLKSLIVPFINAEYTEDEIKRALNGLGEGIPSKGQMDRALSAIRNGRTPGANGHGGRPAVVPDVNAAWADKRPVAASAAGGDRW